MAKRTTIEILEQDLIELETIARSTKSESRKVQRAKIILDWHKGKSFVETQNQLGVSQVIINKWRKRFSAFGIAGLSDAARSGKPSVLTAAQKAKVINLATSHPAKGYTSWSQRRIAKETGMSQSKVQQLLSQVYIPAHPDHPFLSS